MDISIIKAYGKLCAEIVEQCYRDIKKDIQNQSCQSTVHSTLLKHEKEHEYALDAQKCLKSEYVDNLKHYARWAKNLSENIFTQNISIKL